MDTSECTVNGQEQIWGNELHPSSFSEALITRIRNTDEGEVPLSH